jgi:Membrane proteins related to metalloendopeptidases
LFKKLMLTLAAVMVLAAAGAGALLFNFEKPTLVLGKEIKYLGSKAIDLPLRVDDSRNGIRSITIALVQDGNTITLLEKSFPRQAWLKPAGPTSLNETIPVNALRAGIKEGQAELIISVRNFSLNNFFKGNETLQRLPVIMDTKPPTMKILHSQLAIHAGGSGMVLYTLSEPPGRHGVAIDNAFFPGFPVGGKNAYVCYFALPWDAGRPAKMQIIGSDEAGNEVALPLSTVFRKHVDKQDALKLSESFLQQKIPEFEQHYPEMQGTLIEKYLFVNRQIRRSNGETITRICSVTDPRQLWTDSFLRMPGASRAGFADQRTYLYNGTAIDTQTHLGVDIASLERAEIRAANHGKIVFAEYLGIYGNTVIIDHGQGIFSLYSHLSSINATMNTQVKKDQLIGYSGTTGMAGGDHLHFSMLVHGIFVTPVEWWDQRWIDANITSALNAL